MACNPLPPPPPPPPPPGSIEHDFYVDCTLPDQQIYACFKMSAGIMNIEYLNSKDVVFYK